MLQPRRRAEHALLTAVEAYVHGVSTRKLLEGRRARFAQAAALLEGRRRGPSRIGISRSNTTGAILLEQGDEWAVAEGRSFGAESMKELRASTLPATAQEIVAAIA